MILFATLMRNSLNSLDISAGSEVKFSLLVLILLILGERRLLFEMIDLMPDHSLIRPFFHVSVSQD